PVAISCLLTDYDNDYDRDKDWIQSLSAPISPVNLPFSIFPHFPKIRIVEQGSHPDLLRQNGYYRKLYDLLSHNPVR
ncbi:MAG: hypothetical protein KDL31_11725, partial [Kiritimatiellae bacterium]|nr:hypothetical protein [Kiritimatiellia bacterium]